MLASELSETLESFLTSSTIGRAVVVVVVTVVVVVVTVVVVVVTRKV